MSETSLYVKKKLQLLVSVLRPEQEATDEEIQKYFNSLRPVGNTSSLVNHQKAIKNRLKTLLYNNSSSSTTSGQSVANSLQDLPLQYAKLTKLLNNLEQINYYLYLSYIFLLPSISFYSSKANFKNIITMPSYNNNLFSQSTNPATISNSVVVSSNYSEHFNQKSSPPPASATAPSSRPSYNNSNLPSSSNASQLVEHPSSKVNKVRNNFWISKELEYVIMKDLLYCLQGLSGKYIKYDSKNEVFLIDPLLNSYNFGQSERDYSIPPSPLHPAVHDTIMEICELGWLFKKINDYIQNKIFNEKKIMSSTAAIIANSSSTAAAAAASSSAAVAVSNGIIAQAFGYALQTELQEYYGLLSVLEEEIAIGKEIFEDTNNEENVKKEYKLSLLRLVHWLRPCRSRLELLLKMIHTASPLHGGALVSRLAKFSSFLQYEDNKLYYNEEKINELENNLDQSYIDDYEKNQDNEHKQMKEQENQVDLKLNINEVIVENIIVKVCDPFFKQIANWILYGELNDPFNEFFIVKNSNKVVKNIWKENFLINELMLPFFINKSLAKRLLNLGKIIDYIKVCLNFLVNNNNTKNSLNKQGTGTGIGDHYNISYGANTPGLDNLFGSGSILNLFSGNENNFDIESIVKSLSLASANTYSASSYKVIIDKDGKKKYLRKSTRQINKNKHLTLYGRVVDDADDEITRNKKWAKDYEEVVEYIDEDEIDEEISSDEDNKEEIKNDENAEDKLKNKLINRQKEFVKNKRKNEKKNEQNIIKILKVLKNIIKNNDIQKYLIQLKYGNNFFFINYLLYYSYYINKLLLFVLKNYYKLYDYFIALKKFMLLGQGDFFNSLIYLINNELKKKVSNLYHQNLLSILETAIRNSNAQYLPTYITDKITIRFIDSSSGKDRDLHGGSELGANRSNSTETGWNVFSLDYTIRYPLHIIINQQAINSYRTMFHLLWRLKQVEWTLSVTWKQLSSFSHRMDTSFEFITIPMRLYDIFPVISKKTIRNRDDDRFCNFKTFFHHIFFNLFIMKNFITNFNSYMMFDVLEGKFQEFEEKFHRANSLDEIIDAHEEYLRDIQYHALLASNANSSSSSSTSTPTPNVLEDKLQKQLQCILISILYYCELVEKVISIAATYMSQNDIQPRPFTSNISSKNRGQDLSNLQLPSLPQIFINTILDIGKTVKEYHIHLELFMGLLRQEAERSSSEALRFLTFRLDFHNKEDFFTPQIAISAPSGGSRTPPTHPNRSPPNNLRQPSGRPIN